MLINKIREIYSAQPDDFGSMCDELLKRIPDGKQIASLVFFGNPVGPFEYSEQLRVLNDKISSSFPGSAPPMSYIAQKPLIGGLLLEVCLVADSKGSEVCYHQCSGVRYVTIQNDFCRELITGGILSGDLSASTFQKATAVFDQAKTILNQEKMPVSSIVRQWNYIENITEQSAGSQKYHEFNRARSHFYDQAPWENGYPAATGIGIRSGGVIVRMEALLSYSPLIKNIPVNNDLQVPAHGYSHLVLNGNDTRSFAPKFERARLIGSSGHTYAYISGTAAIRGEKSMAGGDAVEQTRITMENICRLIHCNSMPPSGLFVIYLKNEPDYRGVKQFMNERFPEVRPAYLLADLCRDELLVEIEGVLLFN